MDIKYPNLSREKILAVDIETKDPNLTTMGPGVYRKDGHILGVSIATRDGFSEYYNLGHYDCYPEERDRNVAYLREVLGTNARKVGQSLMYDVDWLENGEYGIKVNGPLASIDFAEALLDETQLEYNMDFMGHKYLGRGKEKTEIDRFCEENSLNGDARKWLWKMPYSLVRKYAREDAKLPLEILDKQEPMLAEQELTDLFEIENRLMRPLLLMRKTGVPIDTDARDRNGLKLQSRIEAEEQALFAKYGPFNSNSSAQLARLFEREGLPIPTTSKGSPSINAFFFKRYENENELVRRIYNLKKDKTTLNNFIAGSHVDFVTADGLIHAQFFNLKNDSLGALKGTRSGRLSGANPNLQQQTSPSRDKVRGTMCREDFIPFPGHLWGKIDYKQIEYRFMAHFAVGPGSDELRAAYNANPEIDYHQFIVDLTGLSRALAKNLNFGIAFGMGAPHMAEYFGWDLNYAREILDVYHERAPYVRSTMKLVERRARQRGYIKTFLKRRSRLVDPDKAYVMYCRLVQGSAADLMKTAMVQAYDDGIFDILPPHMTVHDELDVSVPETVVGVDAFRELHHIMESALELRVPILADPEIGTNWATVDHFDWDTIRRRVS